MTGNLVVLGGAGLLGSAISRSAALAGHHVLIVDYDERNADYLSRQILDSGGKASFCKCDVSIPGSVDELIEYSVSTLGRIDAVVNSTYLKGRNYGRQLSEVSVEDFSQTVSLQLGSIFLLYQSFSRYFNSSGGGAFVSIGSIYGSMAPRFSVYEGTEMTTPVEYVVTKSALRQLNRYYAQRYKKQFVRFNIVSPGGILDGQPIEFLRSYNCFAGTKGMLDPDDVVAAVLYLVSPEARFVTGQELVVDDGFSL